MYHPDDLLVFLEQAGQGCISGNIVEWPQLKPACKWAAEEIQKLTQEVDNLTDLAESHEP